MAVNPTEALRADAELMVWTHAESADDLQQHRHDPARTVLPIHIPGRLRTGSSGGAKGPEHA